MTRQSKIWTAFGVAVVIAVVFLLWLLTSGSDTGGTDGTEEEPSTGSSGDQLDSTAGDTGEETTTDSPSPTVEETEVAQEGATDPAEIPEHGIEVPDDGDAATGDPLHPDSQLNLNQDAESEWFPVLEGFTQLQSWQEGRDQGEWEEAISEFSTPQMADRASTIAVDNLLDESYEIQNYWIIEDHSHDYGTVFVYAVFDHDVYIYVLHDLMDRWAVDNFLPDEQFGQDIEYAEPEDLGQ